MVNGSRFKQPAVDVLARRAANICSNPDCVAITSGPTLDVEGTTNVSEAAHIYGASSGSSRFDSAMSPAERSAVSSGIWLCSTCHTLVDDDPLKFPGDSRVTFTTSGCRPQILDAMFSGRTIQFQLLRDISVTESDRVSLHSEKKSGK